MQYSTYLAYSLIANIILAICLLSPNIVYLIHRKFFNWKEEHDPKIQKQKIEDLKKDLDKSKKELQAFEKATVELRELQSKGRSLRTDSTPIVINVEDFLDPHGPNGIFGSNLDSKASIIDKLESVDAEEINRQIDSE